MRATIEGVFIGACIGILGLFLLAVSPKVENFVAGCVEDFRFKAIDNVDEAVFSFLPVLVKSNRCHGLKPIAGSIGFFAELPNGAISTLPLDLPGGNAQYKVRPAGRQAMGLWLIDFSGMEDAQYFYGVVQHKPGFQVLTTRLGPFRNPYFTASASQQ